MKALSWIYPDFHYYGLIGIILRLIPGKRAKALYLLLVDIHWENADASSFEYYVNKEDEYEISKDHYKALSDSRKFSVIYLKTIYNKHKFWWMFKKKI